MIYEITASDGSVVKLEGPEGAPQEFLQQLADEHAVAKAESRQEQAGQDLLAQQADNPLSIENVKNAALEFMAGVNRGAVGVADMPAELFNAISQVAGSDVRAGKIADAPGVSEAIAAGFMEPGPAATTTGFVGEMAAPGIPLAAMGRGQGATGLAARAVDDVPAQQAAPQAPQQQGSALDPMEGFRDASQSDLSVGASQVPEEALRAQRAEEFGIPLTRGMRTGKFEDIQFERETAKLAQEGDPIRQRFAEINLKFDQNFDDFLDETGAQVRENKFDVGSAIRSAARGAMAQDKKKVRALYRKARENGELRQKVNTKPLSDLIEELSPAEATAPILTATKAKLDQIAKGGSQLSINDLEELRKFVNKNAGFDDANAYNAGLIRSRIDEITSDAGGDIYRQARKARARLAKDFENNQVIDRIVRAKPGSQEYTLAMEHILDRSILSTAAPVDSVRKLRTILRKSGEEGQQAWREVQGGAIQHIKDQMLRNQSKDINGNTIVSPAGLDRAIKQLDGSGKLDVLFGKEGAEKIRTINQVAKDVFTAPPGAVNHSNTASALANIMDVMALPSGAPIGTATGIKAIRDMIKSRKLKAKIKKHLE